MAGKVTGLSLQKRGERFNLFIDELFFAGLSAYTVARFGLYEGRTLEDSELNEILNEELKSRLYNSAVRSVNRNPKSEYQIKTYLKKKLYENKGKWYGEGQEISEHLVSEILAKLARDGYIDDKRFAELFIESRLKFKPRGLNVIRMELKGKGVEEELLKEVFANLEVNGEELINNVYNKRYKSEKITLKDKKKIDFLLRRGFNWDEIKAFIDKDLAK